MLAKFKKALAFVPALLAGVTYSGSAVTLEASDITAVTSAGGSMISSLVDNFISLLPVIVLILVGFMVLGFVRGVFKFRSRRSSGITDKMRNDWDLPSDWGRPKKPYNSWAGKNFMDG